MSNAKKSNKVFVSYAHSDAPKISRILDSLVRLGYLSSRDKISVTKDLPAKHHSLRDAVRAHIRSATKVVVIWNSSSAGSQWVNYEMGLADALGKKIVVVVSEDSKKIKLPPSLEHLKLIKLP